ncbi:hypothetical protein Thein_0718 [Thermodesulfatator indicus DSM 15286]|uniref:AAA ATPase n=1 Tax=Thermodesulfatator indicus (strain DSM 15286 / JCM 11887 / CIR29812) TaxID=667014 RepID=F8AC43_THEID|nr:ATP-binding protein [Thermodesulfatator indicus]AEH44598.1 hypothetical protein Thein_0718 [Thermodesulfatator indicus DSM 15286]
MTKNKILKRDIIDNLLKNISNDYILIIVGARQTGKTSVLLYLQNLLGKKEAVSYLSLEDPTLLSLLNEHPHDLFDIIGPVTERHIVLIDEIQYLKDPSNFLKYHYDFNRDKLKLIVTGSSAFYIDQKFKDSLAGRKRIFLLKPLSLKEVLYFKSIKIPNLHINRDEYISYPLLYRDKIAGTIKEMLIYGSYPAVVLENNSEEKRTILYELVSSYTKKDILESGLTSQEEYFLFLKILASQIGSLVNLSEIASTLRISRYKIDKFVSIALKCFHLYRIRPFFKNVRKELSKTPKFYFFDCGLRNALLNNFELLNTRQDTGQLFENFVFNFLGDLFGYENIQFWRTKDKNEIDFIVEQKRAVEAKYSDSSIKLGRYRYFLEKYNLPLHFLIFKRSSTSRLDKDPRLKFIFFT